MKKPDAPTPASPKDPDRPGGGNGNRHNAAAGLLRELWNAAVALRGNIEPADIPGSRRQKQLTAAEVERIAGVYREFRRGTAASAAELGFCAVAGVEKIRGSILR